MSKLEGLFHTLFIRGQLGVLLMLDAQAAPLQNCDNGARTTTLRLIQR